MYTSQKTSVGKDVETLELLCTLVGVQNGAATVEKRVEAPQTATIAPACVPAMPQQGVYPKELKAGPGRDVCSPMCNAAWFRMAERWKHSDIHGQIYGSRSCTFYTHNGIVFSLNKRRKFCRVGQRG